MLVRKLKALIFGAEIRCIRSRNTFPDFLSHWIFTPGFRIGQRYYHRCIFCRFFLVSCYANFFTYVTAPALKFLDYGYLYNTFPVDRYIFIVTMNETRTRLCCWCCLALPRGVWRVVMKSMLHYKLSQIVVVTISKKIKCHC